MSLLLLFLWLGDGPPFSLGDPPLQLEIKAIQGGSEISLSERVSNTFTFWVLPECSSCSGTLALATELQKQHDVLIVYVTSQPKKAVSEIQASQIDRETVYTVAPSKVEPLGFKKLPLVLCYRKDRLHFAGSASFQVSQYDQFVSFYERPLKGQNP